MGDLRNVGSWKCFELPTEQGCEGACSGGEERRGFRATRYQEGNGRLGELDRECRKVPEVRSEKGLGIAQHALELRRRETPVSVVTVEGDDQRVQGASQVTGRDVRSGDHPRGAGFESVPSTNAVPLRKSESATGFPSTPCLQQLWGGVCGANAAGEAGWDGNGLGLMAESGQAFEAACRR